MFRNKITTTLFTLILVLALAGTGVFGYLYCRAQTKINRFYKLYVMDELVRENYINDVDDTALTDGILKGYVYGINDKYGTYFTAEEYTEHLEKSSGTGSGLGIVVIPYENSGYLRVVSVYSDSPADEAGILKDDVVLTVGGEDLIDKDYNSALAKLKGDKGSTAEFKILRGKDVIPFSVTRGDYEIKTVLCEKFDGVGYIKIKQFLDNKTFYEFSEAYDSLIADGISKIIFDVRDNPGGELYTITGILDKLLPEGPIIRISDKNGEFEGIRSDAVHMEGIDAVVLVNSTTYSAAELFASAIKDYDYATLIGTTTYGKGTMQYVVPFSDGSAVRMSTRKFYPPYSSNFEGKGVKPDIEVEMDYVGIDSVYDINYTNDTQLLYALDYLNK